MISGKGKKILALLNTRGRLVCVVVSRNSIKVDAHGRSRGEKRVDGGKGGVIKSIRREENSLKISGSLSGGTTTRISRFSSLSLSYPTLIIFQPFYTLTYTHTHTHTFQHFLYIISLLFIDHSFIFPRDHLLYGFISHIAEQKKKLTSTQTGRDN